MNEEFDEWFRWLYCRMETGARFESKRLLVRRGAPEEWAYDYDGDAVRPAEGTNETR
jgi:hypothetical protein